MAKFSAVIIAVAALLTGAQAACPANGYFCGSELKDVYQCATQAQLVLLQSDVWRMDLYRTDATGTVLKSTHNCTLSGCQNSNGDRFRPPTTYAHCNGAPTPIDLA